MVTTQRGPAVLGQRKLHVFITGGASGLGLALAHLYVRQGCEVAIADLDAQALERVRREELPQVAGFRCDVRREPDLAGIKAVLLQRWGRIDLVFNNAGVAVSGRVEDCPMEDWRWILDTNLMGVVHGCRVFGPLMRAQGGGHLVNIASMAALIHPPGMAAYCATKAGVLALSEALALELQDAGVTVSVVCPGFFRTGLARSSRNATADLQRSIERLVTHAPISAEVTAQAVVAGVTRRQFLILPHRRDRMIWWLKRLLPYAWYQTLLRIALKRPH